MQPGASCKSCLLPLALCTQCCLAPSQPPGTQSFYNALLVGLLLPVTAFPEGSTINFSYAGSSRGQPRMLPADSTRFNVGTAGAAPQPLFPSTEQSGWPTNSLSLLGTQWLYDASSDALSHIVACSGNARERHNQPYWVFRRATVDDAHESGGSFRGWD